ncbi:MAG: hypothetical protein OIN86_17940, partial [Candidatus Methanoperedens sp.]|nr:hypothetical protein [Candidatus Methanoperedens sp.]
HFPFSSHGSRPMRWDFNPADTNVIAHAVTFSSNVLFSTFFLVLRSTLIHPHPEGVRFLYPSAPRLSFVNYPWNGI